EDDGAIRLLPLDNPDVRQGVVYLAVSIVVPGVVKEDQVSGAGNRSSVERTLSLDMGMDDSNTIGFRVACFAIVEIDPMSEKYRASDSGAVIGDASTVALDSLCPDKSSRCPHDRGPARFALNGLTAGARVRCRPAGGLDRRRRTAREGHH